MKRLNCCLLGLGALFCAILFAGCSGESGISTEYVEGVVTMDGAPVAEATVMFSPKVEGQGLSATGTTDENGVYKLNAMNYGDATAAAGGGTLAGEYNVGVIKSVQEVGLSEEEAQEQGVEYVPLAPGVTPEITHVVPVRYNNPADSGLTATVTAGENNIPIELTSEAE